MNLSTKEPENDLPVTKYEISGEGVKRVIQESLKIQKHFAFVYDQDIYGRPVRVGYCFTSRDTGKQVSPIYWFSKDEINISSKRVKEGSPGLACLDVKFSHPKKNEKHFNITLPFGGRNLLFRFIFRIEKDGTKNFVILVQSKNFQVGEEKAITLVRYDCSHGFVHKDLLKGGGRRVCKKEKLPMQDKREAIGFIVRELLKDLRPLIVKKEFQGREKEKSFLTQDVTNEMLKTEESLLELLGSQKMSELLQSASVMYSEEVGFLG